MLEMAKATIALEAPELKVEVLDLARLASEYGREIHPCKACFSTATPLCHRPCSCYPNYSLGQVHDWMTEIRPRPAGRGAPEAGGGLAGRAQAAGAPAQVGQ